jgi:hypothetical protein
MSFAMKTITFSLTICCLLLSVCALAQSGDSGRPYQRSRGMERAYDLPYLTVEAPQPGSAADFTTLVIYAPDSMDIALEVGEWMSQREASWTDLRRIGPGRQEIDLPLYALAEGNYTLRVLRRDQVVAARHFLVVR